jgi:hypothetical protein
MQLKRRFSAFYKASPPGKKVGIVLFLIFIGGLMMSGISDVYDNYKFNHLSSIEHYRLARDMCRHKVGGSGSFVCFADDPALASRHLEKVPSTAPEYGDAIKFLTSIREQEKAHQRALEKERTEAPQRILERQRTEVPQRATQSEPWKSKAKRDEDAQLFSYWPTTIRVNTDMDSFWLPNEERNCQTYPDDKGRIMMVACNATGLHRDHNIPVKFWGGVDRNTISDWKCRREGDDFVCRAID